MRRVYETKELYVYFFKEIPEVKLKQLQREAEGSESESFSKLFNLSKQLTIRAVVTD